jgi:hypothetical protein
MRCGMMRCGLLAMTMTSQEASQNSRRKSRAKSRNIKRGEGYRVEEKREEKSMLGVRRKSDESDKRDESWLLQKFATPNRQRREQ